MRTATAGWNERQLRILELLEADGEVRIGDLRSLLGVTEMTIRRDLEKLEGSGQVRRIFGGAILLGKDVALQERSGLMGEEKVRIGRYAAGLIQPGESVFIDGGTTTFEVARAIRQGINVTAVTNALNVAQELQARGIPTIVSGGMIWEATSTLIGPFAVQHIGSMAYDRIFLGATGFSSRHGFSNSNMHEAEIKKTAMRQAAEVNVVADHTKFEAKDLLLFAAASEVHRVITDAMPKEEAALALREGGAEIVVV